VGQHVNVNRTMALSRFAARVLPQASRELREKCYDFITATGDKRISAATTAVSFGRIG
jgi:hypothetical protein